VPVCLVPLQQLVPVYLVLLQLQQLVVACLVQHLQLLRLVAACLVQLLQHQPLAQLLRRRLPLGLLQLLLHLELQLLHLARLQPLPRLLSGLVVPLRLLVVRANQRASPEVVVESKQSSSFSNLVERLGKSSCSLYTAYRLQ
jgi:hypothetical protein